MVAEPGPPVVTKPVNWLFTWVEPATSEEVDRISAVLARPSRLAVSPESTWIGAAELYSFR